MAMDSRLRAHEQAGPHLPRQPRRGPSRRRGRGTEGTRRRRAQHRRARRPRRLGAQRRHCSLTGLGRLRRVRPLIPHRHIIQPPPRSASVVPFHPYSRRVHPEAVFRVSQIFYHLSV